MFYPITIQSRKAVVIACGSNYYVYSDFFGMLAVGSVTGEDRDIYNFEVGNSHTWGGSLSDGAIIRAIKAFFKKRVPSLYDSFTFNFSHTDNKDKYLDVVLKSW